MGKERWGRRDEERGGVEGRDEERGGRVRLISGKIQRLWTEQLCSLGGGSCLAPLQTEWMGVTDRIPGTLPSPLLSYPISLLIFE